ncbi:MAG: hypothetical protein OXN16_13095 [Gammaproteobacteria bacterium]|nr:hypothetical protein [Gammaproteobacteria bacterium]
MPTGDFGLAHLQAIHYHLFQDIYAWARDVRTVEVAKGESRFQPKGFIVTGMADIHRRIVTEGFFRGRGRTGSPRVGVRCWAMSIMSTRSAKAMGGRNSSI